MLPLLLNLCKLHFFVMYTGLTASLLLLVFCPVLKMLSIIPWVNIEHKEPRPPVCLQCLASYHNLHLMHVSCHPAYPQTVPTANTIPLSSLDFLSYRWI
jgi:hypothetical protein